MKLKVTRDEAITIVVIVVLLLSLILPSTETRRRKYHTCVVCHLIRSDYESMFGNRYSEFEETACSQWYREHVAPQNEHVWQRSPSMAGFNVFGRPIWVSNSSRPAGLTGLTPEQQIALYQNIPNIDEAKQFFVTMRDDAESGDKTRYTRCRRQADGLGDWIDSSFAPSWEEVKAELSVQ